MQSGQLPEQIKQEIIDIGPPEVGGSGGFRNSWAPQAVSVCLDRIPTEEILGGNGAAVPTNEQAGRIKEEPANEDSVRWNQKSSGSPPCHIDITVECCFKHISGTESGESGVVERPSTTKATFHFRVDSTEVSSESEPALEQTYSGDNIPNASRSPDAFESRRGAPLTNYWDAAVPGPSGMPTVVRLGLREEEEEEDSMAERKKKRRSTGKKPRVKKTKKGFDDDSASDASESESEEDYSSKKTSKPAKTRKLSPNKKKKKAGSESDSDDEAEEEDSDSEKKQKRSSTGKKPAVKNTKKRFDADSASDASEGESEEEYSPKKTSKRAKTRKLPPKNKKKAGSESDSNVEEEDEQYDAEMKKKRSFTGKKTATKKTKKGSDDDWANDASEGESEEYLPKKTYKRAKTRKLPPKKKMAGSESDSDDDWGREKEDKKGPRTGRKGGGGGYTKPLQLSPQLSALVGAESMAPHKVVKKIWSIIKEKHLRDPKNKQYAICDDALLKVIGRKRFRAFGMMKYLRKHFTW